MHGPVGVLIGYCCDNVVMVWHKHEMMSEKVFFKGFPDCLKDYACDLPLVEPEGSIVGPADQVEG